MVLHSAGRVAALFQVVFARRQSLQKEASGGEGPQEGRACIYSGSLRPSRSPPCRAIFVQLTVLLPVPFVRLRLGGRAHVAGMQAPLLTNCNADFFRPLCCVEPEISHDESFYYSPSSRRDEWRSLNLF